MRLCGLAIKTKIERLIGKIYNMIDVKNISVYGWEAAFRGMRNPMKSWEKSDSNFSGEVKLGPNDLKLALNLTLAGSSDRKFLRMIHTSMDIDAPLYWWKEMDQYKIATTTNSESTMHKIHSSDLSIEDFSTEYINLDPDLKRIFEQLIEEINKRRSSYTKDKESWYQMIQLLPSSFNQLRTWDANYEALLSIYFQRKNHKLDEWRNFCKVIENLPYMNFFLGLTNLEKELSSQEG